jgi:Tfp pilus assembly protein PilF
MLLKNKFQEANVSPSFKVVVERNLQGIVFERAGQIDKAIAIYEENITAQASTPHTYTRLAILYTKAKRHDDARRILELGIKVMSRLPHVSAEKALANFTKRLEKLNATL